MWVLVKEYRTSYEDFKNGIMADATLSDRDKRRIVKKGNQMTCYDFFGDRVCEIMTMEEEIHRIPLVLKGLFGICKISRSSESTSRQPGRQ